MFSTFQPKSPIYRLLYARKQGFTLIELLVVIVIVGVLTAVATPTFLNQVRRSRLAEAQAALDVVGSASNIYRFDNGVYPNDFNQIRIGTGFMDTRWIDAAPNYGTAPTANEGPNPGFMTGMFWTATASASATAYRTQAGFPIECSLGLGDDAIDTVTTINSNCNL
ncbi:type IV pilin protein [Synechococcus sp. PCC 7336]|uniref:type IV pilin protein n=1 Tax=Synechococcus sp. PCC 7336 TaxID=195250 RepID=UPI00034651AB|nr:prepilin-type N-terminal cleavage/methylation domain-containing protein [Synechococcus sp. PCC 7336]